MADFIFNIAKGALIEKVRDGSSNLLVLLLETAEADSTLIDYDNLSDLFAGSSVESTATGYSRNTGVTGTVVVDDGLNVADVNIPDQAFSALTGNPLVAVIVAYEESASETGRIPLTKHDVSLTLDANEVLVKFP
jgi:hypothetical protein